jgi:hypothetical protein
MSNRMNNRLKELQKFDEANSLMAQRESRGDIG